MTNGERFAEIERLNNEGAERVREQAQEIRRQTIESAYNTVQLYLEADKASLEDLKRTDFAAESKEVSYVLEVLRAAPLADGEIPQSTLSILLLPRILKPYNEALRIHIPVSEDFEIQDYEMPARDEVDHIYLEYIGDNVPPRRYKLSEQYMYSYTSAADTGEEELLGSSDDIMFKAMHKYRTDDAVQWSLKAQIDIIEMTVVPQRMGGEDFIDLIK